MIMNRFFRVAILMLSIFSLFDTQATWAEIKEATITIDASSREAFAFFSFEAGKVVTIKDQKTTLQWDLGLKRAEIIVNGGNSGNGKGGVISLEKAKFSAIDQAPAEGYIADTEKLSALATGDAWYVYTGPPLHHILVRNKAFVIRTAKGNYAKLFFVGYYKDNKAKTGAGHITITYAYQDDGTLNLFKANTAMVHAKEKLVSIWAELKAQK